MDLGKEKFSRQFLEAVDKALCFTPEERPQSIAEWRAMFPELEESAAVAKPPPRAVRTPGPAPVDSEAPTEITPESVAQQRFTDEGTLIVGGGDTPSASTPAQRASAKRSPIVIAVAIIALIGIAIGVWRMQSGEQATPERAAAPEQEQTTAPSGPSPAAERTAAAPEASSLPSTEEVNALLGTIDCSVMQASVRDGALAVDGYVAGGKAMARTAEILDRIGGVTNQVREIPAVFCETIELYAPYIRANHDAGLGARIGTPRGDDVFADGENLIVDATAPSFLSWLYVDYFGHEGSVVHLLPSVEDDENRVEPRVQIQLGGDGGMKVWQIAPPYGTEMIVLLAASKPVFDIATPEQWAAWEGGDEAGSYREKLRKRLDALRGASEGAKIAADLVVVTTREKR